MLRASRFICVMAACLAWIGLPADAYSAGKGGKGSGGGGKSSSAGSRGGGGHKSFSAGNRGGGHRATGGVRGQSQGAAKFSGPARSHGGARHSQAYHEDGDHHHHHHHGHHHRRSGFHIHLGLWNPYYYDFYPRRSLYYYPSDYVYSYPVIEDFAYTIPEGAVAPRTARVEVRLPDPDAEVWLEGIKMSTSGTNRLFESPELEPGMNYQYKIKATWTVAGKTETREREVNVAAGRISLVDFTRPVDARHPSNLPL